MRLLIKIVSLILLGTIVLLAIDGYISIRREIALFDNDIAQDGLLLGRTMKEVVSAAWESGGMVRALELIRDANEEEKRIDIRWVWLDAPPTDPFAPRLSRDKLRPLTREQELSYKQAVRGTPGYRLTYVIIPTGGERVGALELSEPLNALSSYARRAIVDTTQLTVAMVLLSFVLLWVLGVRFVGRPLAQLVEKTKRAGAGDFGGDLVIRGRDELSNLATAMNQMCAQLENARETVQRETEARIAALEQLRHTERLATVGRLASGIAHELGTPLNVVAGRAKIIATEDLDREDVVSFSKTIVEQVGRMTDIIRHLLDFARRRSHERTRVDMEQLARQVIDLLAVNARKADVSLEFRQTSETPPVILDRSQIQHLLMNLMMNGIQAMPSGGKLVLELGVEKARHAGAKDSEKKDYLRIRVIDEGVGIPQEQIKLIFDPFFTTKGVGKGTGLGLSIGYGIVEEHGGWIDVESELGKGTCFSVYLPLEEGR
jgi:two-component system NtrC family sensor kinase